MARDPYAATRAERVRVELLRYYLDAERTISGELRDAIASGNRWRITSRESRLRKVRAIVDRLEAVTDPLATELLAAAVSDGRLAAELDLIRKRAPRGFLESTTNTDALDALANAYRNQLSTRLLDVRRFVVRHADDVYAQLGREVTVGRLTGRLASQTAARSDLVARLSATIGPDGNTLTAFVDRAGRRWSLSAYADMVTRTTTRAAVTEAAVSRFLDAGLELGVVSSHAGSCPVCAPYQGVVVVLAGDASDAYPDAVPLRSLPNGGPPFHPNCRHSIGAWSPSFADAAKRATGKTVEQIRADVARRQGDRRAAALARAR